MTPLGILGMAAATVIAAACLHLFWRQRESRARLRVFFDCASDAVYVADWSGRLVEVNERACEATGYARQELLQLTVADIDIETTFGTDSFEDYKQQFRAGAPITLESRHRRKDGSSFPVELRIALIERHGAPLVIGAARDISERRRQQVEYARIINTTADGFWVVDVNGSILECNGAAARMLGYTESELRGMGVYEIDDLEAREDSLQRIATLLGHGHDRFETRHRRKDGSLLDVDVSITLIPDEGRMICFIRDITERKREANLLSARLRLIEFAGECRATQELLQRFLDEAETLTGSQIGFFHFVEDDHETIALQAWSTNTRKQMCRAEGAGQHYPISQAGVWVDCVRAGQPVVHNDYASLPHRKGLPAGHAAVIRELVVPVMRRGYAVAILGVGNKASNYNEHDVEQVAQLADLAWETVERLRAEDALRASEDKFSQAFWNAPFLMSLSALEDGRYLEVNDAFVQSTGYKREHILGVTIGELGLISNKDSARIAGALADHGHTRDLELTLFRADGSAMECLYSGVLLDVSGQKRVLSTAVDITRRKSAEERLMRAYDLLEHSNEAARIGYWEIDLDTMVVDWSRMTCEIHEVPAGYRCTVQEAINFYDPGRNRERLTQAVHIALDLGVPFDEELTITTARGNQRWVRAIGLPIVRNGKCEQLYGLFQDITGRKEADGLLIRQQRMIALTSRINTVFLMSRPDSIYADALGVVLDALESEFGLFGYLDSDGNLTCPAVSADATANHEQPSGKPVILPRMDWNGIWGQAILERRTACSQSGLILPAAHIPLDNAMAVPIIHREQPIGLIIVANRKGGYSATEQELLEGAAAQTAPILSAFLERERKEREHRALELQYRQAQKMEAIGQLTGGVAHDFNNLLQVINGYTEFILRGPGGGGAENAMLMEIANAGERAARLVSQLLLFSRRQVMRPAVVDLNEAVAEMVKMLHRIIGEHVQLRWLPAMKPCTILADRGMVEQALTNLCVNARDAMPEGGLLTIETETRTLDAGYCARNGNTVPGDYALLRVRDSGCGMDRHTLEHVFEPFFTTKDAGKGTGLGLATVYGIIKQHGGIVDVQSAPGEGACFSLYWPARAVRPSEESVLEPQGGQLRRGSETILLAEDDDAVRQVGKHMLEGAGYTVMTATNGLEAVGCFAEHGHKIDLVILDLVMPDMGGREAFERMRAMRPGMKAFFSSGYSEDAIHDNYVLEDGYTLIQKPYRYRMLLETVRNTLDAGNNGKPPREAAPAAG